MLAYLVQIQIEVVFFNREWNKHDEHKGTQTLTIREAGMLHLL